MAFWVPAVFIGYLLVYRAWRFRAKYGVASIRMPTSGDHSVAAALTRALPLVFAWVLVLGAIATWWPQRLPLFAAPRPVAGAITMLLAGIWIWRAQEDMAASWRVGIDATETTELKTGGMFRFCRHPIYLGLQVGLIGLLLLIPSYPTLGISGCAFLLLHSQARLEERYLLTKHGRAYADHCQKVGRFLPWTGRW